MAISVLRRGHTLICVLRSLVYQDIPELLRGVVRYTARRSCVFVNALCSSVTFRNPCSPGTATVVWPLANFLLHFDHMSNEDGDLTFFRSPEIIGD